MKSLSAALAALSLAFAGAASAAPMTLSFSQGDPYGYAADLFSGASTPFNDAHAFLLGGPVTLSGVIRTVVVDGAPGAVTPYLDIQSAYLRSAAGQRFDLAQTTGFDWSHGQSGVEVWTLAPVALAAGQWTLYVSGVGLNDKGSDGYDASFTGETAALPEPTALALVAVALAALGLSRRRAG